MAADRPPTIALPTPVPCCESRILTDSAGTYRCACGNRRETQGQLALAGLRLAGMDMEKESRP